MREARRQFGRLLPVADGGQACPPYPARLAFAPGVKPSVFWPPPRNSYGSCRRNIKKYLKILKTMLTRYTHPNTTDAGESREPPISRNRERHRDAFSRPVFGRLFRLALRGEHRCRHCARLS